MRLLAHLKANKLKGNHFPCAALLTLSWTRQGSKLGGSGLDFASHMVLSYFPVVHQEVKRTGQAWWRSSKFSILTGPTKS